MSGHAGARGRRGRSGGDHGGGHDGSEERWLVTYADMLTLLCVLFIVLYAISSVNTSKFAQLKSSLATAFNNGQPTVLSQGSGIVGGESLSTQAAVGSAASAISAQNAAAASLGRAQAAAAKTELDEFKEIKQSVTKSLHAKGLDGRGSFNIDERGLVITVVTDALVFTGNSAVLQPEGQEIMDTIAPALVTVDNQLQIDGHTNQDKVSTAPYPSGWELSTARASSVVRYLIDHDHVAGSRLSANGYSDQRPLVPASNPLSSTRNRRVDIVVLSKLPATTRAALPDLAAAALPAN
ncbi:MAG: flagellar motor protein MotB [Frankiales bacterium]|nr:flagellar motor protein MotB [Frankiales bacterium]